MNSDLVDHVHNDPNRADLPMSERVRSATPINRITASPCPRGVAAPRAPTGRRRAAKKITSTTASPIWAH